MKIIFLIASLSAIYLSPSSGLGADLPVRPAPYVSGSTRAIGFSNNRSVDARKVFFSPFDAPFLPGDYSSRIRGILSSITASGEKSQLDDPAMLIYRRNIELSQVADFKLTTVGAKMLQDERKWLLDKFGRDTPGYAQFQRSYTRLSAMSVDEGGDKFRSALIDFYSRGWPYRYVVAEQAVRLISETPRRYQFRDMLDRRITSLESADYQFIPRLEDLDLSRRWQQLVVSSPGSEEKLVGQGLKLDVMISAADSVLESMISPSTGRSVLLPARLIFARNLSVSTSLPKSTQSIEIDAPMSYFSTYSNAMGSVIFLMAVELEEHKL